MIIFRLNKHYAILNLKSYKFLTLLILFLSLFILTGCPTYTTANHSKGSTTIYKNGKDQLIFTFSQPYLVQTIMSTMNFTINNLDEETAIKEVIASNPNCKFYFFDKNFNQIDSINGVNEIHLYTKQIGSYDVWVVMSSHFVHVQPMPAKMYHFK